MKLWVCVYIAAAFLIYGCSNVDSNANSSVVGVSEENVALPLDAEMYACVKDVPSCHKAHSCHKGLSFCHKGQPDSGKDMVSSDSEEYSSSSSEEVSSSSFERNISMSGFTDNRDGQVYRTVKIGEQTWMAENLNYAINDGSAKSYCYGNDTSSCSTYGRLYTWDAAMNACPDGWHLPSVNEWNSLATVVGERFSVGKKLKSYSSWIENGRGTDDFGFTVFAAGEVYDDGSFNGLGHTTNFWSSTEQDSIDAFSFYLFYLMDDTAITNYNKKIGFSVRCVMD